MRAIGVLLAFAGGYADAGSYVLVSAFTGHVTGNAVLMAINLARQNWTDAVACFLGVAAFLSGTALCARSSDGGRTQNAVVLRPWLALEIGLVVAGLLLDRLPDDYGRDAFIVCLCLGLGVQNGVLQACGATTVHTTFVTGMSTSLVDHTVRGRASQTSVGTLACVLLAFFLGAACGGWLTLTAGRGGFAGILVVLAIACALTFGPRRQAIAG